MLYVGHFSFYVPDGGSALEAVDGGGEFTLLVGAESSDEALQKFRDLTEWLDDSLESFESVGDVYLDRINEIKTLPPEGVLSFYIQRSHNSDPVQASISTALPNLAPEYGSSAIWESDDDEESDSGGAIHKLFLYEDF